MKTADIQIGSEYGIGSPNAARWRSPARARVLAVGQERRTANGYTRKRDGVKVAYLKPDGTTHFEGVVPPSHVLRSWTEQRGINEERNARARAMAEKRRELNLARDAKEKEAARQVERLREQGINASVHVRHGEVHVKITVEDAAKLLVNPNMD